MAQKVVIMLGPQGAGKGTQAHRISAALGLPHVSTVDLFRAQKKSASPLGEKVRGYLDSGNLVPDEITIEMLFERVAQEDCAAGFLLDGFPRTHAQAEALAERLSSDDEVLALNLAIDDEVIVARVSGRLVCESGHVYHVDVAPPKSEGVCDNCGKDLFRRKDDEPDVVTRRLAVYHEQTNPLIDYYSNLGVLRGANGDQSPDAVFEDLKGQLKQTA